jgi:hypothetical protein
MRARHPRLSIDCLHIRRSDPSSTKNPAKPHRRLKGCTLRGRIGLLPFQLLHQSPRSLFAIDAVDRPTLTPETMSVIGSADVAITHNERDNPACPCGIARCMF